MASEPRGQSDHLRSSPSIRPGLEPLWVTDIEMSGVCQAALKGLLRAWLGGVSDLVTQKFRLWASAPNNVWGKTAGAAHHLVNIIPVMKHFRLQGCFSENRPTGQSNTENPLKTSPLSTKLTQSKQCRRCWCGFSVWLSLSGPDKVNRASVDLPEDFQYF